MDPLYANAKDLIQRWTIDIRVASLCLLPFHYLPVFMRGRLVSCVKIYYFIHRRATSYFTYYLLPGLFLRMDLIFAGEVR